MDAGNAIPSAPPPANPTMMPFYYQHQQPFLVRNENHVHRSVPSPEEPEPGAPGSKPTAASSPWQRMKWTDAMVRLLVKVVFTIGDDGAAETEPLGKGKKAATASATSQQLKKGKWKSVSKEMMQKGFYVSPQQCEDKFNDLNKRYKRVNELLGKGTACRVVENRSLLDSLDLNPRAREEACKLLNSKHLFFREMCDYHHAGGGGGGGAVPAPPPPPPPGCSHHSPGTAASNGVVGHGSHDDDSEDDDVEAYDEEDNEDELEQPAMPASPQLSLSLWSGAPAAGPMQREWMKRKVEALEEQRVGYQSEALRLEWRRLRWDTYRADKEREMEGRRLENKRMRLENERMLLMLRKRELELGSGGGAASGSSVSVQLSGERRQQQGMMMQQNNGGMDHH